MAISLRRSKLDKAETVKDYGQGKRTPPKLRWYSIVLLISIPLIYLTYLLLDETILAEFQGVVTFDVVQIRSPDAGYVQNLYVRQGQHIQRDQPLLQFNSPTLDTEIAYLKREKIRLEKQIAEVNRQSTAALEKELDALAKDVIASELVFERFDKYFRRQGHIASIELEQARKNVITAKQSYAQMKHQIEQVKLENDLLIEVNYKSKLEALDNKIEQAEIKKVHYLMKSPAKGTIRSIEVHRGEYLPEGQDLINIVTKNNLRVVVFVDPKSTEELKHNAIVTMTFPDHFTAKGKVVDIPNYADKTPMLFQNPLATRENKLVAVIEFIEEPPEKYRVYGLPVEVNID